MFSNIIRHFSLWIKILFLDRYEKQFIENNEKKKFNILNKHKNNRYILIEVVTDYYYLAYYKTLIEDKKFSSYQFIGLWTHVQQTVRKRFFILELLHDFYNQLLYFFVFKKWSKLYKSIGINKIEKIDLKLNDKKIFFVKKLKSRNDLLKLKINKIKVGDLLYSTYLRFRACPTIFIKDDFLSKLIKKTFVIIENLKILSKKYKIIFYFTSYSSYIHHGVPVRYFLQKKINVFSGKNNSQYNKKLLPGDMNHVESFLNFKNKIKEIKRNKNILNFSKQDLELRFSSNKEKKKNLSYVFDDAYNGKSSKKFNSAMLKNIDGVLFLQDFFDSPHDWGKLSFDDFYLWAVYSLNLIKKYRLKIAIKPHPNSWQNSHDSILIYKRLQKKFPQILWLDKDFPNKIIFKNIKFGISCTGTVLFELAYHGIKAISCGTHPGIHFKFTIHAKNKFEYKYNLLNINKIKIPNFSKIDLLVYNYLYYYYNMDAFNNVARLINLKQTDLTRSKGLDEFIRKYENYVIQCK